MVRVRGVGALVVLRDLRVRDPHVRPGQGVATVRVLQGGPVVPGVLGGGAGDIGAVAAAVESWAGDRKSTRLNSSHVATSYAVFCVKEQTQGPAAEHDEG